MVYYDDVILVNIGGHDSSNGGCQPGTPGICSGSHSWRSRHQQTTSCMNRVKFALLIFISLQVSGYTAIFFAAEKGHIDIFKELLAHKADTEISVSISNSYATSNHKINDAFRI